MTISASSSLGCAPRYATSRTDRPTLGPRVGAVAEGLGFTLMPWQQQVVDVALEYDPVTGELAYRQVVLTVPRQSGKTSLILGLAVHRALEGVLSGPQNVAYAAQNGVYARDKLLDDQVPILEASLFKSLLRVRRTNGHEAVLWRNGSKHTILAGTEKAGHSKTLDLVFIDEAFAQIDWRLEQGASPTMITRASPQIWVVSTAGDEKSVYLKAKVDAGRERAALGLTDHVAYFEWSADPDADPGDLETWKSCMPALKHEGNPGGTQPIAAVAAEFETMPLGEFKRAFLNLWGGTRGDPVISGEQWAACLAGVDEVRPAEPAAITFDIPPDRSSGSIGCAVLAGGLMHVDVLDHGPGTLWLVERLVELRKLYPRAVMACDAAGPAGSLLDPLEKAGVKNVKAMSTREHQQACGGFYDAAVAGTLRHQGRPELDAAVVGAEQRIVSDSWLWSRKNSSVDISPLVAVTLAAAQAPKRRVLTEASVW